MWFGSGGSAKSPGPATLAGEPLGLEGKVLPGDAADQPGGELLRREAVQPLMGGLLQVRPDHRRLEGVLHELVADAGVGEHVGQKLLQVEHLDTALGQRVGEGVVLLPRALDPEHVVEEQLVLVGRRQTFQLQPGTVQQHPPQRPRLRAHKQTRRPLGGEIFTGLLENGHRTSPFPTATCGRPSPLAAARSLVSGSSETASGLARYCCHLTQRKTGIPPSRSISPSVTGL